MPTCVLYSDIDMEPITVLDVPAWAFKRIRSGESIVMAVPEPLLCCMTQEDISAPNFIRTVTLWAERFVRKGQEHLFFFTKDEILALKLKPDFLPGQRATEHERYIHAYAAGFAESFQYQLGKLFRKP